MTSSEFAVTFGDRHRHGGHPTSKKAHPDGYAVIEASCLASAEDVAGAAFGPYYEQVMPVQAMDVTRYPLGEILRLK